MDWIFAPLFSDVKIHQGIFNAVDESQDGLLSEDELHLDGLSKKAGTRSDCWQWW